MFKCSYLKQEHAASTLFDLFLWIQIIAAETLRLLMFGNILESWWSDEVIVLDNIYCLFLWFVAARWVF